MFFISFSLISYGDIFSCLVFPSTLLPGLYNVLLVFLTFLTLSIQELIIINEVYIYLI